MFADDSGPYTPINLNNLSYDAKLDKILDSLRQNTLRVEDILADHQMTDELKITDSDFDKDVISKLIDFALEEPKYEDIFYGYIFPFNSAEILSQVSFITDKFLECTDVQINVPVNNKVVRDLTQDEIKEGNLGYIGNEEKINNIYDKNDISLDNCENSLPVKNTCFKKRFHKKNNNFDEIDFKQLTKDESFANCLHETNENNIKINLNENVDINNDYPLLDYLFSKIRNKTCINYVNSGYFKTIFCSILDKTNKKEFIHLIKNKCEYIDLLIFHSDKKSFSDCLLKILNYKLLNEDDDFSLIDIWNSSRISIIEKLIKKIRQDPQEEERHFDELLNNIYEFFIDSLEIDNILDLILSTPNLFKNLSRKISNGKDYIKLLIKINEKILINYLGIDYKSIFCENLTVSTEIDDVKQIVDKMFTFKIDSFSNSNLSKLIFLEQNYNNLTHNFKIILSDFFSMNKQISTKLGIDIVMKFEFILTTVKIFIETDYLNTQYTYSNQFQEFKENYFENFIEQACKYYFQFEFNNIYQQLFENFIKIIVGKKTPSSIIIFIFDKKGLDLTNILQNKIIQNKKFQFSSGRKINCISLASFIKVYQIIYESENMILRQKLKEHYYIRNNSFYDNVIRPMKEIFDGGLLIEVKLKEKILNFEMLDEYEYIEEKCEKENKIEIPSNTLTFNEIFQNKLDVFEKGVLVQQQDSSELDTGFEREKSEEEIEMIIHVKNKNENENSTRVNLLTGENLQYYDNNFWNSELNLNYTELIQDILNDLLE